MKQKIFKILEELNISYENFEHSPTFSTKEEKGENIPGIRAKSLFIRNKKSTNLYMVVLPEDKILETNKIREIMCDTKMSFCEVEIMQEKLGILPGNVSPFSLINNFEKDVKVIFDASLKNVLIGFHPLQNDNTTVLQMKYIEKFLEFLGIGFLYAEL